MRIVTDWTFALLFPVDVTRMSLESEAALLLREAQADTVGVSGPPGGSAAPRDSPLTRRLDCGDGGPRRGALHEMMRKPGPKRR